MDTWVQSRASWSAFLHDLIRQWQVIAPVERDVVRFLPISSPDDIHFTKNAFFPAKEYFFKQEEVLFQFSGLQATVPVIPRTKRVFFGLRKCDLNAIKHQDTVFIEQTRDPYYTARREDSYLLGYHCASAPSPYCFCGSLNLVDFFDLMFYDHGDTFFVEVGSERGAELLRTHQQYFSPAERGLNSEERSIKNASRLHTDAISSFYEHPLWKEGVSQCLSCGACTTQCPTCYCFEFHDELKADDQVERKRTWSSCQVPGFTRVAGDHVFREGREERFKHRIYHQLDYFKKRNGVQLCVGCGRCIEACPTRIDFVSLINAMHEQSKEHEST